MEWFAFTFHEIHYPRYLGFFRACLFFCHILPIDQRKFRSKLLLYGQVQWTDVWTDVVWRFTGPRVASLRY